MHSSPRHIAALLAVFALVLGAIPAAVSASSDRATGTRGTTTVTPTPEVGSVVSANGLTRKVLSVTLPLNAPGQVLYLTRVTYAPKAKGSVHYHEGTQIFRVESGALTYRVNAGTAMLTRASGAVEKLKSTTTILRKGDSVIETSSLVHWASNNTNKKTTLITAALLSEGAGLSTPVGAAVTGTRIVLPAELVVTSRDIATVGPNALNTIGTVAQEGSGILEGVGGSLSGVRAKLNATFLFTYLSGNGTWNGIMTMTFSDGSTISGVMSGATIATKAGGAVFGGTISVVGGTGIYKAVTGGTGTYTGSRSSSLGSTPLQTRTDLHVFGL